MAELVIWMNGERVGVWEVGRTGHHVLEYDAAWYANPRSRPLSISLPFTRNRRLEGAAVANYFDNLLPDSSAIRKRLSARLKLRNDSVFTLLEAIGRDCVGAVQLLPPGVTPPVGQPLAYEALNTAAVGQVLGALGAAHGTPADDAENLRISIAGAQEKTALLRINEGWARPKNATPTTHILKPPIGITPGRGLDLRLSPENEWLCSRILQAWGLPTANCWVASFDAYRALVVERFDRVWHEGTLLRVPQEDFCQILGKPPSQKYESDGGPSIHDCLQVLKGSAQAQRDATVFLCMQLAFWLLAAIDGHAKNFSVFILPAGRYRLTPAYDVLSAWPLIGTGTHQFAYRKVKLAMAVRATSAHYKLSEIMPRHWKGLALSSGVPGLWEKMQQLVAQAPAGLLHVAQELPADFPAGLAEKIFNGVRRHGQSFQRQLELASESESEPGAESKSVNAADDTDADSLI